MKEGNCGSGIKTAYESGKICFLRAEYALFSIQLANMRHIIVRILILILTERILSSIITIAGSYTPILQIRKTYCNL